MLLKDDAAEMQFLQCTGYRQQLEPDGTRTCLCASHIPTEELCSPKDPAELSGDINNSERFQYETRWLVQLRTTGAGMDNEGDNRSERYRLRTAEMLKLAHEIPTEELKLTLLNLAASWANLAQQAEKSDAVGDTGVHPAIELLREHRPPSSRQ